MNNSAYDNTGNGSSSANAWNVNFNNANVNNNNRTNAYYVRPFAESRVLCLDDRRVPFSSFVEAYYHCRRNKRSRHSALLFEMGWSHKLYSLWRDVVTGRYEIGRSICFVVNKPTKREVFAADFRDRIVHHWIAIRLEPLLEQCLPSVMCSNRKGFGTSEAVRLAYNAVNDGTDGVVYKFDIQGFFMAIDKRLLRDRLLAFIDSQYGDADKPLLMSLTEKVIMHCPQQRCLFRSARSEWDGLPGRKSLFGQDAFHGLAIGNLTSQMFANFYPSGLVLRLLSLDDVKVVQYVDDILVKAADIAAVRAARSMAAEYLRTIGLTLHPLKQYIQPCRHGVRFIGAVIKPGRLYPSGRSIDRARGRIRYYAGLTEEQRKESIETIVSSLNSYLGLFRSLPQMRSFSLRKDVCLAALPLVSSWCYVKDCEKFVVKKNTRNEKLAEMRKIITNHQFLQLWNQSRKSEQCLL